MDFSQFHIDVDWTVVIAYAFGVLLLYVVARLLVVPLKFILRLLINAGVGLLLLAVFNLIGEFFDLYLPINPITALVAGFLGIPGIVLLLALQYLLVT